ncbi:hypothetical protein FRC01_007440 [Tulasnella sp. 417]|nr:hypothetical protein FRC01_007440 [Tulasnella sp. 417]
MASPPSHQDKRIIISGLTPAISAQDIRLRFSPFGTVKAVDGVGLVDGNGDPRKFAFVTVELNEKELSNCMSRLNGTKWKGAKLRIGEARSDYKNNGLGIRLHDDRRAPGPLKKDEKASRSNAIKGRHAADMSLTTVENVDHRKHWKRTPLGQIVRPLQMRPDRPIPPLAPTARSSSKPGLARAKSSKALKRAKLTVIDPTRYGSTHLTAAGGMMGVAALVGQDGKDSERMTADDEGELVIVHDTDEVHSTTPEPEEPSPISSSKPEATQLAFRHDDSSNLVRSGHPQPTSPTADDIEDPYVEEEKKRDLDILASLLGNQDTLAWEPDSDLEQLAWENSDKRREELEIESDADDSNSEPEPVQSEHALWAHGHNPVKAAPLKEMFAPRPDESGFSLFDNIADLDVELEEPDVEFDPQDLTWRGEPGHSEASHHDRHGFVPDTVPDHATPFFFPLPRDERGFIDTSFGPPPSRHSSNHILRDVFGGGVANSADSGGFWKVETG